MESQGSKFGMLGEAKYNRTAIAKAIREDLKESFKKTDIKFSVKKDGNSSIVITIKKMPKTYIPETYTTGFGKIVNINKEELFHHNFWILDDYEPAKEFHDKVLSIGEAYNYDNSDIMTDYFDKNYYLRIEFSRNIELF